MHWLIRTNFFFLFLLLIAFLLPLEGTFSGRAIYSLIAIAVVFILPGLNLSALFQLLLKKTFILAETLALGALFSLTLLPLLLTLENETLHILFPSLPLLNAMAIFGLTLLGYFTASFTASKELPSLALTQNSVTSSLALPFTLLSLLGYGAVTWIITTAFYALPDLDPYYWLSSFREMLARGVLTGLSGYRPLFSSLIYILAEGARIDLYAFFKYVLPASFLILIPAFALVAQHLKHPWQKAVIALFPFVNGVTFLYLTEPIPQATLSVLVFFSIAFLAHSFFTRDHLFLLLSGLPLLFGYFYHEAGAILLLLWALGVLFFFRKVTIRIITHNKLSAFLLLLLFLPHLSGPVQFLYERIEIVISLLHSARINLLFPQHYVNIDGNPMGWGNFLGVIKYYLFYAGPVVFLTAITLLSFGKKHFTRERLWQRPEILIALLSFGVFFLIAEILPRLANIALLPERAWIFAGPYLLLLLFPLFQTTIGKNKLFLGMLIIAFVINLGGALYINTLKKYVVTNAQLASAAWIRNTLPSDRVLFSFDNHRLLTFYGNSRIILTKNPDFYFNYAAFEEEIHRYKNKEAPLSVEQHRKQLRQIASSLLDISEKSSAKKIPQTISSLSQEIQNLEKIKSELGKSLQPKETSQSLYIYYAAPHPQNPYANRPYVQSLPSQDKEIIFDQYPEKFKRVYTDDIEKIYIWQIL
jgi:hypothetical protein